MRSFTIHVVYNKCQRLRFKGGRFESETAIGAAKKAFSQIQRHYGKRALKRYEIHIRETTQGSEHKIYKYNVRRIEDPHEVTRGGEKILYKYSIKIKSKN